MSEQAEKFDSWAIVELMGHRRIAGRVTEQVVGGASLLRIDVPECPEIPEHEEKEEWSGRMRKVAAKQRIPEYTQFYGTSAIYCMTPTTEEIARRVTIQTRERPLALFDVEFSARTSTPMLEAAPVASLEPPERVCESCGNPTEAGHDDDCEYATDVAP